MIGERPLSISGCKIRTIKCGRDEERDRGREGGREGWIYEDKKSMRQGGKMIKILNY